MRLDGENTAIVLDSTADFPHAPRRFPNWRVVPLYVRFGAESFRDYVDLTAVEFYTRLRDSPEPPATSQPTPADFAAVYQELAGYERVFSLHVGGTFSGTVEAARTAADEVGPRQVRVVDTQTVSVAVSMLGLALQRRLDRGTSDEEVVELLERHRREAKLLFTVDTLDYLARGGRIGRAGAWAGQLLNVKPILAIESGGVLPVKRVRGNRLPGVRRCVHLDLGGLARAARGHRSRGRRGPRRGAQAMVRRERPNAELELVTSLGPVVGAHAGPGAVGLFWFQDSY